MRRVNRANRSHERRRRGRITRDRDGGFFAERARVERFGDRAVGRCRQAQHGEQHEPETHPGSLAPRQQLREVPSLGLELALAVPARLRERARVEADHEHEREVCEQDEHERRRTAELQRVGVHL